MCVVCKVVVCVSYVFTLSFIRCSNSEDSYIKYALEEAGVNKNELKYVLDYYETESEKLSAAKFLIANMPGHYSYLGNDINLYYNDALELFRSELTPSEQRDSLLRLAEGKYYGLNKKTVQDIKVVSSAFLISNIDKSFEVWKNGGWSKHLDFKEFCDWILPYKCAELQSLDMWRDSMSVHFSEDLSKILYNDESLTSTFKAVDVVRKEIVRKIKPTGLFNKSGYPMLSAATMSHMTYGRCTDYVNLAVLTYRSLGIPAVIDETPLWGRYRAGHSWYVILNNNGKELPSEWDVSSVPGTVFFPYQRISKVYRNNYSINKERVKYQNRSTYKYPFSLFQEDVTDKYVLTSDIDVDIEDFNCVEQYVYLTSFCGHYSDWAVIDYAETKHGKAHFNKIGRNVLYLVEGYNGKELFPIYGPFVIRENGERELIGEANWKETENIVVRRKYFLSENVAEMKTLVLGGFIEAANTLDFYNATQIYTINTLEYPDKILNTNTKSYQYWRYVAPPGSGGNIAEFALFDRDGMRIDGKVISNNTNVNTTSKAFDDDWLTFYEDDKSDGSWIGLNIGAPKEVGFIRVVPRGDDNDIHPGDEYELRIWDGHLWVTFDTQKATSNKLVFEGVPKGALLWLRDKTRGWDERPFVYRDGQNPEWW